ncbi:MAG: hypothetical protein H0X25_17180 [Acidobacteriales bacterium]|nr:hypothetical protein [Terriglobales bacterium]
MKVNTLAQQGEVDLPVGVGVEHEGARVAALRHMVRNVHGDHSGKAGHF